MQTLATLAATLGLSAPIRVPADDAALPDADLHAAITVIGDRLLERVATVTGTLRQGSGPLTESEQLAARLLLSDLALLASAWQALGTIAAGRLDTASQRLDEARQTLERSLRAVSDVTGSDAPETLPG